MDAVGRLRGVAQQAHGTQELGAGLADLDAGSLHIDRQHGREIELGHALREHALATGHVDQLAHRATRDGFVLQRALVGQRQHASSGLQHGSRARLARHSAHERGLVVAPGAF